MSLEYFANCLAAASGDAKTLHLNCVGDRFDRAHKIAGDNYDELSEAYDLFAEMAREFDEVITNPNNAASVANWPSVQPRFFTYTEVVLTLTDIYERLLTIAYATFAEYDSDEGVKNGLAGWIQSAQKELRFRLRHRI